jgi:predicted RNase H-like HicB family nuclease
MTTWTIGFQLEEQHRVQAMKNSQNQFEFPSVTFREGRWFVSLCLELDVASQGRIPREAKKMLAEAVNLYLETCFEDGVPYLRPCQKEKDPRLQEPGNLMDRHCESAVY